MRTLRALTVRRSVLRIVVSSAVILSLATGAVAGPQKVVKVDATGQIVFRQFCSLSELCQNVQVTGTASHLGRFTGVLSERVDLATGKYAGTGVFTMANGSTITTEFAGDVAPPDQNGDVFFAESHQMVDGTGQYENASGDLDLSGTADAEGKLSIVGVGTLNKG